jgi:hypothetical protein
MLETSAHRSAETSRSDLRARGSSTENRSAERAIECGEPPRNTSPLLALHEFDRCLDHSDRFVEVVALPFSASGAKEHTPRGFFAQVVRA